MLCPVVRGFSPSTYPTPFRKSFLTSPPLLLATNTIARFSSVLSNYRGIRVPHMLAKSSLYIRFPFFSPLFFKSRLIFPDQLSATYMFVRRVCVCFSLGQKVVVKVLLIFSKTKTLSGYFNKTVWY